MQGRCVAGRRARRLRRVKGGGVVEEGRGARGHPNRLRQPPSRQQRVPPLRLLPILQRTRVWCQLLLQRRHRQQSHHRPALQKLRQSSLPEHRRRHQRNIPATTQLTRPLIRRHMCRPSIRPQSHRRRALRMTQPSHQPIVRPSRPPTPQQLSRPSRLQKPPQRSRRRTRRLQARRTRPLSTPQPPQPFRQR